VSIDSLAEDLYGDSPPASALTQIQAQISQLRKLLDPDTPAGAPGSIIETRPPGYVIRVVFEQLDLRRFERLAGDAADAAVGGAFDTGARLYREALDLWRGPALADLAGSSARPAIARLDDLRLTALEGRIEAELQLGRHSELAGELEALVAAHPLRERMHGQLMLALYRAGRQADALEAYRRLRRALVDELGLEPGPGLQQLEHAILRQDSSLDLGRTTPPSVSPHTGILVVASNDTRLDRLVALAEPLAAASESELILIRPVVTPNELGPATAAANARRRSVVPAARAAAFTTTNAASDIVRMATAYDVELVLVDAPTDLDGDVVPRELAEVFEHSLCHVGVLAGIPLDPVERVVVPFGGGDHDWAALELGAQLVASSGGSLTLVGTAARPQEGRRDSSRLLADASLAVQRLVDVDAEPMLVEPTEAALLDAVDAALVVAGVSARWRKEGVGATRRALLRATAPVVLVHRGLRPGGLAPRDGRTRFTWTIQS
jgi:DNA-binding SARP family transcriptional activator